MFFHFNPSLLHTDSSPNFITPASDHLQSNFRNIPSRELPCNSPRHNPSRSIDSSKLLLLPASNGTMSGDQLLRAQLHGRNGLLNLIKSCGKGKHLSKLGMIHANVLEGSSTITDAYIATALITAYVDCGDLEKSRQVFEQLRAHNVVAWNSLIAGYVKHRRCDEALKCFREMQDEGLYPNTVTYICILTACGFAGLPQIGEEIYIEVRKQGLLQKDVILGNSVVAMYSKCGMHDKAREVFMQLPTQNVVSWNTLITGYAQYGLCDEALECLRQMQDAGVCPDVVTYVGVLKACGSVRSLKIGQQIDVEIRKQGFLMKGIVVGNALVDMYCKCGVLEKAKEVFDLLPKRNVVSWNTLMTGYARLGHGDEVLSFFRKMQDTGVSPNAVTYICALKACGTIGSLKMGELFISDIKKQGLLQKDVTLGAAVMDMYSKCGALEKAEELFEKLMTHNIVVWNTLLSGYIQHGFGNEALKLFKKMEHAGITPSAVTYIYILKACGIIQSLEVGEKIHMEIRKEKLLQKDVVLGTALVDMYSKCGALQKAQEAFEKLPVQDVVSWSALISGYVQHGHSEEALNCFMRMQKEGVCPNTVTYICVLKACASLRCLEIGEHVHAEVKKQGLLQYDIMLATALVDMYSKCGAFVKAQDILRRLPKRDVVPWSALISGYIRHGLADEALECFEDMQDEGIHPDATTYASILKACGIIRSLQFGEDIDAEIKKQGVLQKDVVVGNSLIDMYFKCNAPEKAKEVFRQLPVRDVMTWNALIAGYVQHGQGDEALRSFKEMQDGAICPNVVTFVYVLKACSIVGSVMIGKTIDAAVRKQGMLLENTMLGNTLVDMYFNCGMLESAEELFEQLPVHDVVSWNVLLGGFSHIGQVNVVFNLYGKMRAEGVIPNSITFTVLLTSCTHAGLLEHGEILFNEMCSIYHIYPTLEHYTCMIDLFARAGHFDKANVFLERVSHSGHLPLFHTILAACGKWRNLKLGKWVFEQLIRLDEKCAATYVCMENIYVAAETQIEAEEMENFRVNNKTWNISGCTPEL